MFNGNYLPTHQQRSIELATKYQNDVNQGVYRPYTYPFGTFGAFLIIIYLLIPHRDRPVLKTLRFVVWAINLVFSLYIILNFRASKAPIDYGIGLITWWFVLWTTAVMIAHDGQGEFARIERVEGATRQLSAVKRKDSSTGRHENGVVSQTKNDTAHVAWKQYPTGSAWENIDWIVDMLSNFRGMSWNWRISSLPSPPESVRNDLKRTSPPFVKEFARPKSPQVPEPRDHLLRHARNWFIFGYFCLDFLRTIVIHDPYYHGLGTSHKIQYLPEVLRESPVFHQAYRLVIGLGAVYWALATIFQLAPLFFVGILGANMIGVRGEPWMYPREWGSFTAVLDKGLAGWWAIWWHQTFRFAFEAPSKRLLEVLKMDRRSLQGKALQLFLAFALSGSIHACGSHTSLGPTRPIRGPFMFFFLQPFGILGQMILTKALQKARVSNRLPVFICRVGNFVVVYVWFYYTAPLLVDDLAIGGTLLYEPVPFSVFRLLGLGGPNESSICWSSPGKWLGWHKADAWWESGLSV